jgi:hypothetical protein
MYVGFLDDQALRWGPGRAAAWREVAASHASVVRTIVDWATIAKRRPRHGASPFDPAYRFGDLDEFVRAAQASGVEVLLTLWGTPRWANGGAGRNVPPRRAADFRAFAHAVARRYSGAYPTLPFVRFISIWNEPNSRRFLRAADQASAYAALAQAGYVGVKAGSPHALVAVGETAASHAPARFVAALARDAPGLRFDAWAHHPYPATPSGAPDAPERWPDVGVPGLGRFDAFVSHVFGRTWTPLWVTEYAESRPAVTTGRIAADLEGAILLASRVPAVSMFVWFMLENHRDQAWQSGLAGTRAFSSFREAASSFDPRNGLVSWPAHVRRLVVRVPTLELRARMRFHFGVIVSYSLSACGIPLDDGAESSYVGRDGFVRVSVSSTGEAPTRIDFVVRDLRGHVVRRHADVITPQPCELARRPF